MIIYLLKSALCLGILLAIYHLLLEREKMHRFNRFFLLASLIFSLLVPLATYEVVIPHIPDSSITYELTSNLETLPQTTEETNFLSTTKGWLVLIYAIIAFVLCLRFSKNLLKLAGKAIKNPIKKWREASLVMLPEEVLPHSFLKYIFIENEAFKHKKIAEELLLHELEHVKQKHSLDIILIELLQIVFWFNPLLFFYKKAIKLNHEFLADTAVLSKHNNVGYYQQLLLSIASFNTENHLASSINYSITKKRLEMMTKHTKKARAWIKSLVLLPLFAILLYSFSEKVVVQEEPTKIDSGVATNFNDPILNERVQYYQVQTKNYTDNIKYYLKYPNKEEHDELVKSHEILTKYFNDFSDKEKEEHKLLPPPPYPARYQKKDGSAGKTSAVQDKEMTLLVRGNSIIIDGRKTTLNGFAATLDRLTKNLKDSELTEFHFNVRVHNTTKGFVDKINKEYQKTRLYKANPDGHGIIPPPPPAPPKASEAPEVNEVIEVERVPEINEVIEVERIPEVNEAIELDQVVKVDRIPPPPPPIPADATPELREKYQKVINEYAESYPEIVSDPLMPAPPPPTPPVPSEHMKEMAQKGAVFYYEGKKITSKEAIKIAEENESIHIQIRDHDSKNPIVKLSTKPIRIKR